MARERCNWCCYDAHDCGPCCPGWHHTKRGVVVCKITDNFTNQTEAQAAHDANCDECRRVKVMAVSTCEHREHPIVNVEGVDQTLGVVCTSCGLVLAWCWRERHIPESLWNRVCDTDLKAVRCEQSRDDYCALCRKQFELTKETASA